jgi:hypothetical protein
MDPSGFDTLTRVITQTGTRRRALATLVGVALVGCLGRAEGTAKGKRHRGQRRVKAQDDTLKPTGKKCTKHGQCLSGFCDQDERDKHGTCQEQPCTGDCTVPTCTLGPVDSDPPVFAEFTVQDTGSGLASILVTLSENADTVVPPFTVGTKDPVVLMLTEINQSQPADITLLVTDVAGNVTTCVATLPCAPEACSTA